MLVEALQDFGELWVFDAELVVESLVFLYFGDFFLLLFLNLGSWRTYEGQR